MKRKREPKARVSVARGNGVAVWQLGGNINTRGESRSVEAEHRECISLRFQLRPTGGATYHAFGYDPTNGIKSSIHYKPGRYTRGSCAERYVFTPGGLPRVRKD